MDGSAQRFGGIVPGTVTLGHHRQVFVRQRFELAEMFGFESRNRYEVVSEGGVQVARHLIGPYITSLEMQGASVTILRLDDEKTRLWDAPVHTPALRWGV